MSKIGKNKILKSEETSSHKISSEYALIPNPANVFPPYEVVPLSEKIKVLPEGLTAVVMDMDGTTTTTEQLCIHSLEYMVRKITGRMNVKLWKGLDPESDYPHIIGNSTTKHVEYLIHTYRKYIIPDDLIRSFIYAAVWTLIYSKDLKRKEEVRNNLIASNLGEIISDKKIYSGEIKKYTSEYFNKFKKNLDVNNFNFIVRASTDIYYWRYHQILAALNDGEDIPEKNILPVNPENLIEPMPGAALFLSLIKGLLGDEAQNLSSHLIEEFEKKIPGISVNIIQIPVSDKLQKLSSYFSKNPLKTAIVTSSMQYEAHIVMSELFKGFREQIKKWNISESRIKNILKYFASYKNYYNVVVTADDSTEMRLKPHRDLYSLALQKLNVTPEDFNKVIGFEDSESGTIAIRAAGINLCVAVPFTQSAGHNLKAASHILNGGLPEAILNYNLFLNANAFR